jgi:hypothetical protein
VGHLNADNTFSGGIEVNGTLAVASEDAAGTGATVVNSGGTLLLQDDDADVTGATMNPGSRFGFKTFQSGVNDYTGQHPTEVADVLIDDQVGATVKADDLLFTGSEITFNRSKNTVVDIANMSLKDGTGPATLTIDAQSGKNQTRTFNTEFHDGGVAGDVLSLVVEVDKNTVELAGADSTFTGGLIVNNGDQGSGGAGVLTAPVGLGSTPFGMGDITVEHGQGDYETILVLLDDYIYDDAIVTLTRDGDSFGQLLLDENVDDVVAKIILDGVEYTAPGTYGSSASGATVLQDDNFFDGEGVLRIGGAAAVIPEPVSALAVMLGVGAIGRYVRRRRS